MDYDELIESWQNGNISTVAAQVAKMAPSEVLALASELIRGYSGRTELNRLQRAVQRAESNH